MPVEYITLAEYKKRKQRKNTGKYNSKKTVIDGLTFDSIKESHEYMKLRDDLQNKRIKSFNHHWNEVLLEGFKYVDHGKDRSLGNTIYEVDFRVIHNGYYYEDGLIEFREVKSNPEKYKKEKRNAIVTLTAVSRLKIKMLKNKYKDRKDIKYSIV